jgi:hypothetical protein
MKERTFLSIARARQRRKCPPTKGELQQAPFRGCSSPLMELVQYIKNEKRIEKGN